MRIVSMVPSATEILCALGLAEQIVAISHDCDYPDEILHRPRLTATKLGSDLSSYEIDKNMRESASSAHSLYVIERELLRKLNPDLVITQEQCRVCAVDRDRTVCALEDMQLSSEWLSLTAADFSGLYQDILKVGSATRQSYRAQNLVGELKERIHLIAQQSAVACRPRVFCLSWFDPLMAAGSWISEMVWLAGGEDRFGAGALASSRIAVDQLVPQSPQVICLLPCSFSQTRTAREWQSIRDSEPWRDLPAVREGRVFTLESSLFHRPGPRLVDGVELMASLLHPDRVSSAVRHEFSGKVA
jgi:iron complex transport system substrate-binding protein